MAKAQVVRWNGTDVPPELRELPPGRYEVSPCEVNTPEQEELIAWVKWNGNDIPSELRTLPAAEYFFVVMAELSAEECAGLELGLDEIHRGETEPCDEVSAIFSRTAARELREHLEWMDLRNPRKRLELADEIEGLLAGLDAGMVIEPPETILSSGRTVTRWPIAPLAIFTGRSRGDLCVVRVYRTPA